MRRLFARLTLTLLLPFAVATVPTIATANDLKPVEWVIGYAPGGASDTVARILAEAMGKTLNQTMIVLNKPGAGSNIAADYVAKSREVRHTVFTADSAVLAANPFLYSKLTYEAEKDLAPVGMIARFPLVLVVAPNVPVKNLQEFLVWAKSNASGTNYASPGTGSPHHLVTELFRQQTSLKLQHVPYRGAAPALQDLVGGQVPFMFVDTTSGGPFIASGKVKAIGVASASRLKTMGEIPTLSEQGLAGFEAYAWQALMVPSATPAETVSALNRALVSALESTAVKARMQVLGVEPMPGTPAQLANYARSERERWGRVIRDAGIKLD